jgi:hypothetical protein
MHLMMASLVQMDQILLFVRTAIFDLHSVVSMQRFSTKQRVIANRASPVLVLCDLVVLRAFVPIGFAIPGLTILPVLA